MKKRIKSLSISSLVVFLIMFSFSMFDSVEAMENENYDFCKNNPAKNTMVCEQQCPSQVECGGKGKDCYGHGSELIAVD